MSTSTTRRWIAARITSGCIVVMLAVASATTPGAGDTRLERGAYLVTAAAACAGCHTPRTATGPGASLSGGNRFGPPQASVYSSNITPDPKTGIGGWSDRQIAEAIRHGRRPDGSRIAPPMPQLAYSAMSDADVDAIVAYLRSVPPVVHQVPASAVPKDPAGRDPSVAAGPRQAAVGLASEDAAVARGRYIATALAHCTECHTPVPLNAPDMAQRFDAGGRLFQTREGAAVSPGIRASDLATYSDAALATVITRGVRPDGSRLRGPMPVASYAGLHKDDLDVIIAFLRSSQRVGQTHR